MANQYQKVKSVGKLVIPRGKELEKIILDTVKTIATMVGGTLGPGGQPVLIERQEDSMPPIVTKDGVTVFQNLGFDDSTAQVILEALRDTATRTAKEAGDGTSNATVLAEAIVRLTHEYCKANPKVSPQRVMRRLNEVFKNDIEPLVRSLAVKATLGEEEGDKLLRAVASISANGDTALADAVMKAYHIVGDDGNVTIQEVDGPSAYEVERVEGYPITGMGWEDSCSRFSSGFINDPAAQRVYLEDPIFVVYHGKLTEIQSAINLMERIATEWQSAEAENPRHNVVLVTTGFSEAVLAQLAMNFVDRSSINVIPLLAPNSPMSGGQLGLLEDLCAYTGCKLLDPLNAPMDSAELSDLGYYAKAFEMTRYRTTVFAEDGESAGVDEQGNIIPGSPPNELPVLDQIGFLTTRSENGSELDKIFLQERIGKLSGGIARLKVIGSSSGETRERRDRVEDAVCAVRGAIKHGCLPGGTWVLNKIRVNLNKLDDSIVNGVLDPAFATPMIKLLSNAGFTVDERNQIKDRMEDTIRNNVIEVYDVLEQQWVDPFVSGILDSLPAVLEAIRNSISGASLMGTLGGTISFPRDRDFDVKEARETRSWLRDANVNEADTRS